MNEDLIKDKCIILTKMIISLAELYHEKETSKDQRKLIETTIGAAIFYLPHPEEFWTGVISLDAIELLKKEKLKKKMSKEHILPRKKAAIELLTKELSSLKEDKNRLFDLFLKRYSKYNYVTPKENRALREFQKSENYDYKEAYNLAKIEVINMNREELDKLLRKK